MERTRFSNKELAKNNKANPVIPEGYIELKNPICERETDKAFNISFIAESVSRNKWFPKSRTINIGSKYYVENWLLKD